MNSQELPLHPSVEAYEKLAKDMVAAIGSGDSGAIEGLREHYNIGRELTVEELRINATRQYGHTGVAELMLDRGVDVGTKVHGMTGLHWSMVGGHIDTIRLLLQRNAPLEVENDYGGTALGCLIWAVRNSDRIYRWPEPDTDWAAIVQLLIDAGVTVYENDSDFPTGNQEVDELLRRHGMKP